MNLAQALHLVNSKNIRNKLASDQARAASLVRSREASDADRIAELYRRALSRPPGPRDLEAGTHYLERRRTQAAKAPPEKPEEGKDEKKNAEEKTPEQIDRAAYEDIIWALLNTKEFLFNH